VIHPGLITGLPSRCRVAYDHFEPNLPMILYCIRHGQSVYNAEGRIQGQSNVPLSELGRRQSEALARALADLSVEAIYASPLRRAMQTAEVIAEALRLPVQTDPRLQEIDVGVFQDRLPAELAQLYPEELARWSSGDPDFVIPGGESRRQVGRRGREAFESIREAGPGQAVVVSHGRLLIETLKAIVDFPPEQQPHALHNGSITTLSFRRKDGAQALSLNRIDHLRGIGPGGQGDL
jgi:broad specificity phosphatase PhoE